MNHLPTETNTPNTHRELIETLDRPALTTTSREWIVEIDGRHGRKPLCAVLVDAESRLDASLATFEVKAPPPPTRGGAKMGRDRAPA